MALLVQNYQAPDTSWIVQLAQNAAQMRQRQAEQAQNYALQIAENSRREAEAKDRMQFERDRADELGQQFRINSAFNQAKDIREAKRDAANDIVHNRYIGAQTSAINNDQAVSPPLPNDPSVGATADPNAPAVPVDNLPPLPGDAASQIAGFGTDETGRAPMNELPGGLPIIPKVITPAPAPVAQMAPPTITPPPAAPVAPAAPGVALGLPGADYTPASNKPQDYASQIAKLDQTLRGLGVRNKEREATVSSAATRLIAGEQKADLAGTAPTIEEAAKAAGLTQDDNGDYYKGRTLYQVAIRGGKPYINPVKNPGDGGLREDPNNPGVFTKPGSAALFKKNGAGEWEKVGTAAKVNLTIQGKDGKPINVMNDGTYQDAAGKRITPDEVHKLTGALDPAKFAAAGAKENRQSLQDERQFFANEAKRARDEGEHLRKLDLSEKPKAPVADGGKYYKGASKAIEIDKAGYDSQLAAFNAYQKKIKDADDRASTFEKKVNETQQRIDALPAPGEAAPAPIIGLPGAQGPTGDAVGGPGIAPGKRTKYVWKDGKLVAE